VCLHGSAIVCALKQIFAQSEIFFEGTLSSVMVLEDHNMDEVTSDDNTEFDTITVVE